MISRGRFSPECGISRVTRQSQKCGICGPTSLSPKCVTRFPKSGYPELLDCPSINPSTAGCTVWRQSSNFGDSTLWERLSNSGATMQELWRFHSLQAKPLRYASMTVSGVTSPITFREVWRKKAKMVERRGIGRGGLD